MVKVFCKFFVSILCTLTVTANIYSNATYLYSNTSKLSVLIDKHIFLTEFCIQSYIHFGYGLYRNLFSPFCVNNYYTYYRKYY